MKNKAKRIVSAVCALAMCAAMLPAAAMAEETTSSTKWEISKSKTATNLDENYESQVTLSLPAADYEPIVDVVLVIDVSSSMKDADISEVKTAAHAMLDELEKKNNVDVNVGIVTFDKEAHNLTTGLVSVEEAATAVDNIEASSDTNMMAGLMAGKEMLDAGTADASSKYMVLMSDGIPIYWMEDGEPTSKVLIRYAQDKVTELSRGPAGSEPEGSTTDFDTMYTMEQIMAISDMDTDSNEWKQVADTGEDINPDCKYTNIVKSTYMTAKYLQSDILGKYKLKMVAFGTDKYEDNIVYQYGENFCDWIGEQESVDYYKIAKPGFGGETGQLTEAFSEIANDLIYLLDAGSKVKDVIGYGDDYNMDFQADLDKLTLTVNGESLDEKELPASSDNETACYGFGADNTLDAGYKFVLHYYAKGENGASDECLVWDINVPVSVESPVQLTYTVKLTNPQTVPGTYGQYDEDGSESYEGLLTNKSATLYPVDSNGESGSAEDFAKPTVSYTVEALKPDDPTYADLNALLDAEVQCTTTTDHATDHTDLLDGSYDVTVDATNADSRGDGATATVTVKSDLYVQHYNDNMNTGLTHTLASNTASTWTVQLEYVANETTTGWTLADGQESKAVFYVSCPETTTVPGLSLIHI